MKTILMILRSLLRKFAPKKPVGITEVPSGMIPDPDVTGITEV